MYYWNKANLTGLKAIAKKYESSSDLSSFANYCELREGGQRKEALSKMREFVAHLESLEISKRRSIAATLAEEQFHSPEIHQLIPHPLNSLLVRTFIEWAESEPTNPTASRWAGFLSKNMEFCEQAIAVDPDDGVSRTLLLIACRKELDYMTHHLGESMFLGSIEEAFSVLARLDSLCEHAKDDDTRALYSEEGDYYRRVLNRWLEYQHCESALAFPDWCNQKGERFRFCKIVYHD